MSNDKFDAKNLSDRAKVGKDKSHSKHKDKAMFIGVIGICILIGIVGLIPKSKAKSPEGVIEKDDASMSLHQNLELIAALKERNKLQANTGYQGSNPNKPPILRTLPAESISKETMARMNAPSSFFTVDTGDNTNGTGAQKTSVKTLMGHDSNSDFLNQQNDIGIASAKRLPHPTMTVPAGEMIPATMETAVNSELAGMVRAITTRDIYALSGDKLLIPKGSTLVGQFNTAISQGQSRVFVVWNRLQMTNGIIVTLNSPSTDAIGRSGSPADYIDRHFFERFGNGVLLSVLGAYTATGGVNGRDEYNSVAQYRMNIASSFQQAANQTLQQDMQTRPTLQINQGAVINVFVAQDLDFYRVGGRG